MKLESCRYVQESNDADRVWSFTRRWVLNISAAAFYEPAFELCLAVGDVSPNAWEMPGRLVVTKRWFEELMTEPKKNWSAIAVLAHEIGHFALHSHAHSFYPATRESIREMELEADEFAGFALKKLSLPEETLGFFRLMGDNKVASPDHHGTPEERFAAAKRGWMKATIGVSYDTRLSALGEAEFFIIENQRILTIGVAAIVFLTTISFWVASARLRFRGYLLSRTKIFISYRRSDSAGVAGRLYDALAVHIPEKNLFLDVDSISGGSNFTIEIGKSIEMCNVSLILIGSRWLGDEPIGSRRIDGEFDLVRLEVETSISLNKLVIPVLIDDTTMPDAGLLPSSIAGLTKLSAMSLRHSRFGADCRHLLAAIRRQSDARPHE